MSDSPRAETSELSRAALAPQWSHPGRKERSRDQRLLPPTICVCMALFSLLFSLNCVIEMQDISTSIVLRSKIALRCLQYRAQSGDLHHPNGMIVAGD